MERTLVIIKPDGIQRGLIGEIVGRFEKRGFKLCGLQLIVPDKERTTDHYYDLKKSSHFPRILRDMTSGPACFMVWEGEGIVKMGRMMLGSTDPANASPGTIRGDLAISTGRNVCHASDSTINAEKEIALWFPYPGVVLVKYTKYNDVNVYCDE